jgi:hypothetical protein
MTKKGQDYAYTPSLVKIELDANLEYNTATPLN